MEEERQEAGWQVEVRLGCGSPDPDEVSNHVTRAQHSQAKSVKTKGQGRHSI